MNRTTSVRWKAAMFTLLALSAAPVLAQHHEAAPGQPDKTSDKPGATPASAPASGEKRVGDPFPFDTCPISGKQLGAMGDPVVKVYDGREVRFCCSNCPARFEKDLAASLAKLDEQITKDQGPIYPLKTSLVTGKDLPEKPFEFVYGNRLIRLGAEGEKADFLKEPKGYLDKLNQAVIADQLKAYPLKKCPSSGDELGEMGEAKKVVLAGRLIQLCCNDCKPDLEKNPAKFIKIVDDARNGTGDKAMPDHGQHKDADQPHQPK